MTIADVEVIVVRSPAHFGCVATTFAVSALVNVAQAHENVFLVEYAPPELYPGAVVRASLAGPEPRVVGGVFATPTAPGLGVEADEGALRRLRLEGSAS